MAEAVFIFMFAIPAILGLAEIIHTVKLWMFASKKSGKRILVLVPGKEEFGKQILNSYEQFRWNGTKFADRIVVLDYLVADEDKTECKKLTDKLGMELCTLSELSDLVL